jgi:hypothetical protein
MGYEKHKTLGWAKAQVATVAHAAAAPGRAFGGGLQRPPISRRSERHISAARDALAAGEITRQDFDESKRAYEYFGQREAAGLPPLDLTY